MSAQNLFRLVPTKRDGKFTFQDETSGYGSGVPFPLFDTSEEAMKWVKKNYPKAQVEISPIIPNIQ